MSSAPEVLNTSPSRFEDRPKLFKIERGIAWTTGIILLIAGIVYAAIRSNAAFVHEPNVQVNFNSDTSVNYPAVTICPAYPFAPPLILLECLIETGLQENGDCSNTLYARNYALEAVNYFCLTVNDPLNGQTIAASTSIDDELEIEVFLNSSTIPPGEPLGILVMLHDQGTSPYITSENAFLADVGHFTDAWLRKDVYYYLNNSKPTTTWSCTHSQVTVKPVDATTSTGFVELNLVMERNGEYSNTQYYVYTVDNWFGEVGGFCALLLFLHASFNWLVMLILERVLKDERGNRLSER